MSTPGEQEVAIGTAIVSYIEPAPGYAVAFNRWYERDHFPATVLAGPGVFAGARFVATRDCRDLRPAAGTLFGDPARGAYLAVAWVLPGKQAEWDAWVVREMEAITAAGRLFAHREHLHTAVYRFAWSDGDAITVLTRGAAGVVAHAVTGVVGPDDVERVPGVSVGLVSDRTIVSATNPPPHTLVLTFTEGDPRPVFGALDRVGPDRVNPDRVNDEAGSGFASPFLAVVPGTDTYTDEL